MSESWSAEATTIGTEYGDGKIARANEILRTVVGSGVHGIAIEGTDDHDEMGVFVEPPDRVVGIREPFDHYMHRTQPEGARSGPGDVDLVMYSLRKYLRLAAKGNPTALVPMFAPEDAVLAVTKLGRELRDLAPFVLSQQAGRRFLGYLHSQRERLMGGGKRNRVPNRPELVARYGYDVKYAAHALRLAYQGREVVRDARLTLPMPDDQREHVLAVKRGELPQAVVVKEIDRLAASVEELLDTGATPLPPRAQWDELSRWSIQAHRRHWQQHPEWRS